MVPPRRRRGVVLGSAGPRHSRRATPLPGAARVAQFQAHLLDWYAAHGRDLPWRRTSDPYAVLVSEIMLQQTQVPRVVTRYEEFLHAFPTLEALAGSRLAEVLRAWRGLGYNNRAERLRRCAATCVAQAAKGAPAALPTTLDELRALPGLGPYTARAVLVFAQNADLAAVDANVRRVLTHGLDLAEDLSPAALQTVADAVLPRGRSRDWHNALMDYGSLVLTARATGIAPRTRQGRFEGSSRWYRSRLLRTLLDDGPRDVAALARHVGLDAAAADELCRVLERDGLVRRRDDLIGPA